MSSCVIRAKGCFGKFEGDRVCDLCELVRPEGYVGCIELTEVAKKQADFLKDTERMCTYRSIGVIAKEPYCNCTLNNKTTGKLGTTCDVALKCYKYSRHSGRLEKVQCPACKQVAVWDAENRIFRCTECGWESKSFKVLNQ